MTNEYLEACAIDDNPAFDSLEIQNILVNQKLRELIEKEHSHAKEQEEYWVKIQKTYEENLRFVLDSSIEEFRDNKILFEKLLDESKK